MIGCQTNIRLFLTIRSASPPPLTDIPTTEEQKKNYRPDESVHFGSLDIIQLLDGILNLTLVRLDINDEHEGVVLFDLLHR